MSLGKQFDERERALENLWAHEQDEINIQRLREAIALTHLRNSFGTEATQEWSAKYGNALVTAVLEQRREMDNEGKLKDETGKEVLPPLDAEKLGLETLDVIRATRLLSTPKLRDGMDRVADNIDLRRNGHDVSGEGHGGILRSVTAPAASKTAAVSESRIAGPSIRGH